MKQEFRDPKPEAGKTPADPVASGETETTCQRCGFPVAPRPEGCMNPCSNCGFLYPLGDCSD